MLVGSRHRMYRSEDALALGDEGGRCPRVHFLEVEPARSKEATYRHADISRPTSQAYLPCVFSWVHAVVLTSFIDYHTHPHGHTGYAATEEERAPMPVHKYWRKGTWLCTIR